MKPCNTRPIRGLDLSVHEVHMHLNASPTRIVEIRMETPKDSTLHALCEIISLGWPENRAHSPTYLMPFWNFRDELSVEDGMVLKGQRIILPKSLHAAALEQIHYAHQGAEKCKLRAKAAVSWCGINHDIDEMVKSCAPCQAHQVANTKETLIPHDVPKRAKTTPVDHNLPSPCEILNGRKYKSNLPAVSHRSNGDVNAFLQQRQDVYKSYHDRTAKELAPLSPQQTVRVLNPIRKRWDLAKVINRASTSRSYNIVDAQGTAYRRNRRHLRDTQEVWKEQSSNDGINDDLEDDRAAAHPDAIPQPESPMPASHTQRFEARRSSRVSKPPNKTCDQACLIWIQSTGH